VRYLHCRLAPSYTVFPYTTLFRSTWNRNPGRMHPAFRHIFCFLNGIFNCSNNFIETDNFPFTHASVTSGGHTNHLDIVWRVYLRSEEHTSELQSRENLVCRLLLEK